MTAQGFRPNQMYKIKAPGGAIHEPPEGRCWSTIEENYKKLLAKGRIYFGKNNNSQPNVIRYLSEVEGHVPWTWWPHEETGHTDEAKKEMHKLFGKANAFPTPKPERLMKRVLEIASDPGDLVLDSFAGSGTTGAVAHKMGRRWIMIELGAHCDSHIAPRVQKVISGEDSAGVSPDCKWSGGGGFRYFTLAPSLLEKDKFGNWIINKKYNKEMLVEALCKLEGFQYEPSESVYWQHGHSTENDFIYVTTQTLTKEQIQKISDEVGPKRSLLICCGAFRIRNLEEYPNLTLKKIPRAVMAKCEWGKDDYSLEIKNLAAAPEPEPDPDAPEKPKPKRRRAKPSVDQMGLFEMGGAE